MSPLSTALESLTSAGVDFEVFENVSIEPDNDRCDYDVTCTCNVCVHVEVDGLYVCACLCKCVG